MSPADIQVKINIAQKEADFWRGILARKACKNCSNWQSPGCELAGGEVPPEDIVKAGCDAWLHDGIPF